MLSDRDKQRLVAAAQARLDELGAAAVHTDATQARQRAEAELSNVPGLAGGQPRTVALNGTYVTISATQSCAITYTVSRGI